MRHLNESLADKNKRCNLSTTEREREDLNTPFTKRCGYYYYGNKAYVCGYTILDNPGKTGVRKMDTSKFPLLTKGNVKWKSEYNELEKQTYDELNGIFGYFSYFSGVRSKHLFFFERYSPRLDVLF